MVEGGDRDEMEDRQGFLKRWSRRKLEGAEAKPAETVQTAEPAPAGPAPETIEITGKTELEAKPEEPIDPADLPDIDSLDKDSDYTDFLKEGVPPELRRLALAKLFRSDPALAVLDGLNDYDEDFTLAKVAEKIVSSYKPGRGYVDDDEEEEEAQSDEIVEAESGDDKDGGDGEIETAASDSEIKRGHKT